jgi:hypothetical protein
MAWLSTDVDTSSRFAAFVKLRSSATARKAAHTLSSSRTICESLSIAATGKTTWVYDPETGKNGTPSNNGFVHGGVAFWADPASVPTFGQNGRIDLTRGLGRGANRRHYGVSSPRIICPDVM